MKSESRYSRIPPAWLVDWMQDAGRQSQCHSLVLDAAHAINLGSLSTAVAEYLNEFDHKCGCPWRTFDSELLELLANDSASRRFVLSEAVEDRGDGGRPDLERVTRHLARLGGVIIVGRCGIPATIDLKETFHVYLCRDSPPYHQDCHLWVNPVRFAPDRLVSLIANSFLDWSCPGAELQLPSFSPSLDRTMPDDGPESTF